MTTTTLMIDTTPEQRQAAVAEFGRRTRPVDKRRVLRHLNALLTDAMEAKRPAHYCGIRDRFTAVTRHVAVSRGRLSVADVIAERFFDQPGITDLGENV